MVLARYHLTGATLVGILGLLLCGVAIAAAFMGERNLADRIAETPVWAPVFLAGYIFVGVFAWMSSAVLWQALARGGRAAWISDGRFRTATWSVNAADVEDVRFERLRRFGVNRADVIEFVFRNGRRKYLSAATLMGDGEEIAERIRQALRQLRIASR